MARFRPEDWAIDRATDRHGIHEVAGPLLAGGVSLIGGLLYDDEVRHALTDERRFRAHLEFRERAFRLAAHALYATAKSPVDLFRLIDRDGDLFDARMVEHIMMRHTRHDGSFSLLRRRPAAVDVDGDGSDGIGDAIDDDDHGGSSGIGPTVHDEGNCEIRGDKISIMRYLPGRIIRAIEDDQKFLYVRCCDAQRYFACWKLLMKLDFIQPDSDAEDVLEKIKSSTRWLGLKHDDSKLRHCLESHMYFLKEYEKSRTGMASSRSEYENAALEKINSELSSLLHNHLDCYDMTLMEQYYDRAKLRQLARECATQAQGVGVILVGEALPVNPQVRTLPLIKRIQGKFRTGADRRRPWQLLALATLATVTTAGRLSGKLGFDSERIHG